MAAASDLGDLFYDLLKQVWHAEKKFHASLPKLAKSADSDALRAAFKRHEIATERQMSRLGTVFTRIDKPAKDDATVVVGALVDECLEALSEYKDSNSLDAALIARAQAIEHFEIACYGTLKSWAAQLGYDQAVALLEESLEEEEDFNETLTEMAEAKSNKDADKRETKLRKTRAASRRSVATMS
jgi:ferritin-like metal-binding protein YciE